MKALNWRGCTTALFVSLLLFMPCRTPAQHSPPVPIPGQYILDWWRFDDTNWLTIRNYAPISATNVDLIPDWNNNALRVDSTNAAWLQYHLVETNGETNLTLQQGSLSFWFLPNWSSTNLGGSGPGVWSRLIDVGAYTTNAAYGWWSLYLDPAGVNIYFSAQTNGLTTNYLSAPIAWDNATWHEIVLTWCATNTLLYLDGALVTNGDGVSVLPGPGALTNGFFIGSDHTGTAQSHGQFDDLWTYNYQIDDWSIFEDYAFNSLLANPFGGGFHTLDDPLVPGSPVGSPTGSGSIFYSDFTTNDLWLEVLPFGTNAYNTNATNLTILVHNTTPDLAYQLLQATNLPTTNVPWLLEQNFLGADGTNVTPLTVPILTNNAMYFRVLAFGLDADGDGLPDWWENLYGLDPNNSDTGNTGVPDGYKQDSAGDGYNNLQKYQMGIAPNVWVTPLAPGAFSVSLNTNGTSVTLAWNPAPGPVTSYIIKRADPSGYQQWSNFNVIATISATNSSFTDTGTFTVGDPLSDGFSIGSEYEVYATYAGGSSAVTDISPQLGTPADSNYTVNAKLVRGHDGRWLFAFSAIPSNLQTLRITWWDRHEASGDVYTTQDIQVSNLVNGCYNVPDSDITNHLGGITLPDEAFVQGIGPQGQQGRYVLAGAVSHDSPYFVDGRQHLQESLIFLLRAGSQTQAFSYYDNSDVPPFYNAFYQFAGSSNFAASSFLHIDVAFTFSGNGADVYLLDDLWPFTADYQLRSALYSTNPAPSFNWQPDFVTVPAPAVLTNADPYWILAYPGGGWFHPNDPADWGANVNSTIAISLASGLQNTYGLALTTALAGVQDSSGVTTTPVPLAPGASASLSNWPLGYYYTQAAAPILQTVGYYFAPIITPGTQTSIPSQLAVLQKYPVPLSSDNYWVAAPGRDTPPPADFSVTNQTPLIIVAGGQPMVIGGWAKQAIVNGATNKYGYLGQYFDQAYKIDTNGVVTTNTTGILSPYGEFLPTEPGPTALVTMTNYGVNERGTNVVNVIKLQLDVNHDGIMDLTFAGPDNTSADRPFTFWVNFDWDAKDYDADPGKDVNNPLNPHGDASILDVHSQRDLEDFGRLWICGIPGLSNGYLVTLSWNVISGAPSIQLVNAVETNGGIGYLTNSIAAASQATTSYDASTATYSGPGLKFATVSPGQSYTFASTNFTNGANKYFLFDGAGIGKGELVMTISQNGTNIATTSAFIELKDVKDMYERAYIANVTNTSPGSNFFPSIPVRNNNVDPQPGEDANIILFVHGWRMGVWDYENFSETMFKRLYWQGYHGRFASLRWPTLSQDDFWLPALDYATYNSSEFRAWKSGSGLSAYLTNLKQRFPNYNLNVCAHSMGNVVMAEALRLQLAAGQQNVNNYVLMQAAVPASCYDTSFTNYTPFLAVETNQPTPNTYKGYPGAINGALTGRMVDFYNTNDYALATGTINFLGISVAVNWEANQEDFKPDVTLGYDVVGTNCLYGFTSITDNREIMAFCARPRSKAVGAQLGVSGVIHGGAVDLKANFGFDLNANEHSAQFNWSIQQVWDFYTLLLDDLTAH